MTSNWGNTKEFKLIFQVYRIDRYRIEIPYLRLSYKSDRFEHVDNMVARKNANHIIRFFNECWEDDIKKDYPDFIIKDLSVNGIYISK